jgi:hypothetical protein
MQDMIQKFDLDCQTDTEMLHIRKPFHLATEPLDSQRTVVFGHTPTAGLPGHSKLFWGKVWFSPVLLPYSAPCSNWYRHMCISQFRRPSGAYSV